MRNFLILLFISSILLSCGSRMEPTEEYSDLEGTTWKYSDSKKHYFVTFKPKGVLRSTNKADVTPKNDHWKQSGANVTFSFNDKYVVYKGTFKTSKLIEGTAINKVNKRWKWKLVKKS